jgi:DNA-binding NtrC family response regulator
VTKKAKILIVDDDLELLSTMSRYLELKGLEVFGKTTGEEAQELMSKEKFDLIILDIVLPGINGIEILKSIKKKNPEQKVIVMTAMLSIENTIAALREGAVEYLLKPFSSMEYIWTVIEDYL